MGIAKPIDIEYKILILKFGRIWLRFEEVGLKIFEPKHEEYGKKQLNFSFVEIAHEASFQK